MRHKPLSKSIIGKPNISMWDDIYKDGYNNYSLEKWKDMKKINCTFVGKKCEVWS